MILFQLFNHSCGRYSKRFKTDAELNRWITEISEEKPYGSCPNLLADGYCGCRITITVKDEK